MTSRLALPDIQCLAAIVRDAAREELLPRFMRVARHHKADGSVLTEADLAIDARLHAALAEAWPDIGFLSEEMGLIEQDRVLRNAERPLWCLDPLDGTSNFAAGVPLFCVSLALIYKAQIQLGIVYDPVRDECFTARRGAGTQLNGVAIHNDPADISLSKAVALIDFKRLAPALRNRLCERPPYHSQRNFGSCALEWAWLAAGRGDLYLHGGQKPWDLAAGCLLLAEAGGVSFDLRGERVFVAGLEPRSVVAATDPRLAHVWLNWLRTED
jgi:myo-inositol-1(or 4)-monophosphatase